jgi:hypothetical protein
LYKGLPYREAKHISDGVHPFTAAASGAELEPVYGYGVPVGRPVIVSPWFLEAGLGVGFEWVDRLHFRNPLLAGLLQNNSDEIVIYPVKNSDRSFVGNLGLGYFFDRHWYFKGEYRYLGHYTWSGTAAFAGKPAVPGILQEMTSSIHGVLVGLGFVHDFTPQIYIDVSAELGAALIASSGTHPDSAIQFPGEQVFVKDIGILSVAMGIRHHF